MRHLILYHTAHSLSNYFAQIFLVSSGFSACRRRGLPRPIAVPRPSPRDPLHPKFHLAFGIAESPQGDSLYASPTGPYFSMKKSNQKSLGEDPETPYASERSRPETLRIPGVGLDDADKEPQAHFNLVPANRLQEVTLSSLWVEQAAICPDGPSPATGEGDGVGADAPAATLGAYLRRRTDDAFTLFVSSTANDRKGFVKGESVPLDPVLLSFAGTKGRPPRRAVLIVTLR